MMTILKRTPLSGNRSGCKVYTLLLTLALLPLLLGGCSGSDSADTLELLSTVPADAETVGVLRINTLINQTGGKVKDGRIENSENLLNGIKKFYTGFKIDDLNSHFEQLLAPESGIEASSMVIFVYRGEPYITGMIADEDKLVACIDKLRPGEWTVDGKTKTKSEFSLRNGRLWIHKEGRDGQIETFSNLSEVESFRSNEYAATISKATDAFSFWGSIEGVLKTSGISFSKLATTRMALGMFFNSPTYIVGEGNIEKDNLRAAVRILDNKLNPSKCELAVSKIDTSLVASLGGNANFVFAGAVSQKLIKQLIDLASSFGGNMPEAYSSALEPLDGTIAFAATMAPSAGFSGIGFKGAVQTSGKNNARLLQILEPFVGKVEVSGDTFLFGNDGYGTGAAKLSDVAKEFDGAWIGVSGIMNFNDHSPNYTFTTTVVPSDNSLRLDFKMNLK